ncbi:ABC transporter ATP-binding protein [Microlunatus sp. GCM10028923]|uniref:ABC transporter ATP-binding protein n=1 Tax=Microlunatus sp. GCM10028923 TaxID=3273400 RepID=UPI00360D7588
MNQLITVEDLTIQFPTADGTPAIVVDGLSFTVESGEALGLVGESGSGKSMTALAIMGLLPPTALVTGSIRLTGPGGEELELVGRSDRQLRRIRGMRISMVFQDPLSSLNPYYTVGDQVAEAYRAHRGGSRADARKAAIAAMERVHLRDPARTYHSYPHQFSGGMRQRIMIAMALVCEPELVIADEPTTALDVTVQAQVLELIKEVRETTKASLLFITHDLAVVSRVTDRVLVLNQGVRQELSTTRELFTDPQSAYTKMLIDATPRLVDPGQGGGDA